MGEKNQKWRKRKPLPNGDRKAVSSRLREARDLIQDRSFAEGLSLLDREAAKNVTPLMKVRILGLAGDASAKQGKLNEALNAYLRSEQAADNHPRAWLRPCVAQVKQLLRHGRVEDSFEVARRAVARSLKEERDFKKLLQSLEQELETKGQFVVIQRPPRSSVVSTRLGHLFLKEGELESAQFFFEKVIEINPNGGCRSRLGMAEILLRSRDHRKAHEWALDGLKNGKYQAKTLSGWAILLAARRGQGFTGLPPAELAWLKQNWLSSVGQRALQIAVTELRKSGDPLWRELVGQWLASAGDKVSPSMSYNFRRMLVSGMQSAGSTTAEILPVAQSMWNTQSLSLREQLSAARALIGELLKSDQEVSEKEFILRAKSQFGKEGADRMSHSIAELFFESGLKERAAGLLQDLVQKSPPGSKRWGRSTWRLAKYRHAEGRVGEAAELYLSIAGQGKTPQRIRNFSLVEALRAAAVSGRDDITVQARPYLETALGMIEEPGLLMDMSRQLGSAPDCWSLSLAFRNKGEIAVRKAILSASAPSQAASWLFQYARRQNDWGDFDGTIAFWESMDDARKLWLWTPKAEFWEYLAYVLRAYGWRNRLAEAEKLASQYVDDPSTPSDGAAILDNSYAAILMYCGRVQQALAIFQQVIQESPRHPYAGYAYYWFALRAIQAGDFKKAGEFSANIRECLDDRSQLSWMRDLIIKSRIITEMGLGTPQERIAPKLAANYPEKDLKRLLTAIQTDRKKVL